MPADFYTTRWTRVNLAKADSEDGRRALADLCDAYYEPVVAYLGSVLRDADTAREMSHAFFADVLEGGAIGAADPERGRFRFYLLGAVKHFLSHHREAALRQKRGGGVATLSLDADLPDTLPLEVTASDRLSPDAVYDRQWAITVLARAMGALTAECEAGGKVALLEALRPSLLGEAEHGDQSAAAAELGMSAAAVKVAVHRLRQRFRQCVKEEIAGTLSDPGAVEDEMRSLFLALGG
ncbi:RNA polymerase sigma factor [Verrucomicrobium spinosum]|uniref:RNA polymerase sigma factor n=1 Tax=Verrucomicrobium spinosum TaxID=2736 RepID=UPI000303FEC6|nr:sigma-70 family RNA polymerase sigma factor [Verrucomicrobium spinosum]